MALPELQELVNAEIQKEFLQTFVVPDGFRSEISSEFKFGFCFPKDWKFSRFPKSTQYGFILDTGETTDKKTDFVSNVNVIITDISSYEGEIRDLLRAFADQELKITPNAIRVSEGFILPGGRSGYHQMMDWVDNEGRDLSADQTFVVDKFAKTLFVITCTATHAEFEHVRKSFEDIISTFRVP